ncbi:MAG: SCO family protein [Planctomycetaceae bacterium]|nr:SCO family protein [Planctomycetaceae bacterium]
MSTTNEAGPGNSGAGVMRPAWFWTGAAVWVALSVMLVLIWRNRDERRVIASGTGKPVAAEATTAEKPVTVTLPISQMTRDGQQVIDLSDLMGQSKSAVDAPMWDAAGVEDFSFTNSDGRTVTKADLLGRPWAICFVFTKCLGPCPTVTKQFRALQDRLRNYDVRLVTLTVDPARDTPDVLANYAKLNGADLSRWYFLSGDQAATYGLIHRSFKMPVQEVTGPTRQEGFEVIHSTNVMLVDKEGVVRGKFNAAKDEEMASLRRELQRLAEPLPTSSTAPHPGPVADGRN